MNKNSPKLALWPVLRLSFIAAAFIALGTLLLHPQDVSAQSQGTHVHSPGNAPAVADSAGTHHDLAGGAAPTREPDNSSTASSVTAQSSLSGLAVGPRVDGGSAAANSSQRSLSDAAATPQDTDAHQNSANPAPSLRGSVAPSQVLDGASQSLGGCLKEYGDAGECLPVVPPSQAEHVQQMKNAGLDPASMPHQWTCAEVRLYFPKGIVVRQRGVDPQRLDRNGDSVACGAAD